MKYYVYVLFAKDGKLYIGYTTNLKQRLISHASGKVRSTKHRRYLKLIYYEYFVNKKDAKMREIFLKCGAGHQQLSSIIKNTFLELKFN